MKRPLLIVRRVGRFWYPTVESQELGVSIGWADDGRWGSSPVDDCVLGRLAVRALRSGYTIRAEQEGEP
jgi:hypothetical protein